MEPHLITSAGGGRVCLAARPVIMWAGVAGIRNGASIDHSPAERARPVAGAADGAGGAGGREPADPRPVRMVRWTSRVLGRDGTGARVRLVRKLVLIPRRVG